MYVPQSIDATVLVLACMLATMTGVLAGTWATILLAAGCRSTGGRSMGLVGALERLAMSDEELGAALVRWRIGHLGLSPHIPLAACHRGGQSIAAWVRRRRERDAAFVTRVLSLTTE